MLRAGFEGNAAGTAALRGRPFARAVLTARRRLCVDAGFDALSKFHPVGRICEPEEIAQVRAAAARRRAFALRLLCFMRATDQPTS